MKTNKLLLLGVLAVGGYMLWRRNEEKKRTATITSGTSEFCGSCASNASGKLRSPRRMSAQQLISGGSQRILDKCGSTAEICKKGCEQFGGVYRHPYCYKELDSDIRL